MAVLLVVDTLIYLPFIKAYDATLLKQEAAVDAADTDTKEQSNVVTANTTELTVTIATKEKSAKSMVTTTKSETEPKLTKEVKVLVLCAGGGTSEQLANALTEGAEKYREPIVASAGAYGSHHDILPNYDLVVLAPQVRTYYNDLKADTDRLGIKLVAPKGQQYIALTCDSKKALDFIMTSLNDESEASNKD